MGESAALMAHFAKAEPMRTEQGLRCIRRQNDEGYHYFIANLTPHDVNGMASLAVPFGGATLYNPMTGDIAPATIKDGKVQLSLRSGESIILKTSAQPTATTVVQPTRTEVLPINGKWTLSFIEEAPKVGKTFTLDKPQTWEALSPETAITMGTGVYTTTFTLTKQQAQQQWSIDLGDVRESARVYINNQFIGCAWAVPFILDCKNALEHAAHRGHQPACQPHCRHGPSWCRVAQDERNQRRGHQLQTHEVRPVGPCSQRSEQRR